MIQLQQHPVWDRGAKQDDEPFPNQHREWNRVTAEQDDDISDSD